mgnify:CR=1 FL=1
MIYVIKRGGSKEPLSEEKYNRVLMWGVEGIDNVSASSIAFAAATTSLPPNYMSRWLKQPPT